MSHHVCDGKPEMCLMLYTPAGNLVTQIFAPQFDNINVGVFKQTLQCLFIHISCTMLGNVYRGGSRTAATSKMELFVIIINGWKPLTMITKHSILDVAAVLDVPLV